MNIKQCTLWNTIVWLIFGLTRVFCISYVCLIPLVRLSLDYGHTPLQISKKFGINVFGTKTKRRKCKKLLFSSRFKMAVVLWGFCSNGWTHWPILMKFVVFGYLFKPFSFLWLCQCNRSIWKGILFIVLGLFKIRKQGKRVCFYVVLQFSLTNQTIWAYR